MTGLATSEGLIHNKVLMLIRTVLLGAMWEQVYKIGWSFILFV
jgi:hypothetical protein